MPHDLRHLQSWSLGDWLAISFFPACLLIPAGGEAVMILLCLLGATLGLRDRSTWQRQNAHERWVIVIFLGWFLLKALSLLWSIDRDNSFGDLGNNLHFLLAMPVLVGLKQARQPLQSHFWLGIQLSLIGAGLYALFLFSQGLADATPAHRYEAAAQNPLVFAVITSVMLVWLLERLLHQLQPFSIMAFLLGAVALYLSYSRAPLLVFGGSCFAVFLSYATLAQKNRGRYLALVLLAIVGATLLVFSYADTAQSFAKIPAQIDRFLHNPTKHGTSIELRLDMWSSTLEAIQANPIFGYGTGNANLAASTYFHYADSARYNHVHNTWLQIIADCGLIGLLYFLVMIGALIKLAHAIRPNGWIVGPIGALLLVFLTNGFANVAFDQGLMNSFFVTAILFWIAQPPENVTPP